MNLTVMRNERSAEPWEKKCMSYIDFPLVCHKCLLSTPSVKNYDTALHYFFAFFSSFLIFKQRICTIQKSRKLSACELPTPPNSQKKMVSRKLRGRPLIIWGVVKIAKKNWFGRSRGKKKLKQKVPKKKKLTRRFSKKKIETGGSPRKILKPEARREKNWPLENLHHAPLPQMINGRPLEVLYSTWTFWTVLWHSRKNVLA